MVDTVLDLFEPLFAAKQLESETVRGVRQALERAISENKVCSVYAAEGGSQGDTQADTLLRTSRISCSSRIIPRYRAISALVPRSRRTLRLSKRSCRIWRLE